MKNSRLQRPSSDQSNFVVDTTTRRWIKRRTNTGQEASVVMLRLSYPTEAVLSKTFTRNRIVLSLKDNPRKYLRRRPRTERGRPIKRSACNFNLITMVAWRTTRRRTQTLARPFAKCCRMFCKYVRPGCKVHGFPKNMDFTSRPTLHQVYNSLEMILIGTNQKLTEHPWKLLEGRTE